MNTTVHPPLLTLYLFRCDVYTVMVIICFYTAFSPG